MSADPTLTDQAAQRPPNGRRSRRPLAPRLRQAASLPPEPKGAAPSLIGVRAPGFERDAAGRAALDGGSVPMAVQEPRRDRRLEALLLGSAFLHAGGLALMAVLFAMQTRPKPPTEPPSVDMVFGSSGMTGATSKDYGGGGTKPPEPQKPPAPKPPPEPPQQQPVVNTSPPPLPQPDVPDFKVPDFVPVPPPQPPAEKPQPKTTRTETPMRIPLQAPRHASRNPFANPMNLTFSQPQGPTRARTGRPGGSGSPIDLSIGPLVKNGHLNTPYATVGVKGVSDDYAAEIDAWIRRHMYYPPDAAQRGEDGPSSVHVVLDRDGRVKDIRLVSSSGSLSLDDATQGMFRGSHLPPAPPDMKGERFDIDLTIHYILERH